MVLLTPALRALKKAYPASQLTFWLRPRVADVMETHPYVDACLVDTKAEGRLRSLKPFVNQIRQNNFDLAVVLHPTSFRNALLPFLARVPIRIGSNVSGRGMLLTKTYRERNDVHEVPGGRGIETGRSLLHRERSDVHEVQRYLRVLQLLGDDIVMLDNRPDDELDFWHTDADRGTVQRLLSQHTHERLIGINLGTTWETKRWHVDNFAAVIQQIGQQISQRGPNVKIVLTGSAAERDIAAALHCPETTVNLAGKTTILQLGALIERFRVYLTCDSGPMHIAAAVGTPTVSLFGPTAPARHRPYGNAEHIVLEKPVSCRPCYKRVCYRKDAPHLCMTEIRAAEVAAALTQFLV